MNADKLWSQAKGLDAPRSPSAARMAAEALFSAPSVPPAGTPDMPEAPHVVRRKPPMEVGGEASHEEGGQPKSLGEPETRAPRVFRLDSGGTAVQAGATPEVSEPGQREPLVEGAPPAPAAVRRLPRKKTPKLHGEVTIIRPLQAEAPETEASGGRAAERPVEIEAQPASRTGPGSGIEAGSSPVRRRRPVDVAVPVDDDWPHYPKLMTRIRSLEAEAKLLKARETAEAIQWIRGAMARYGLTAKDLRIDGEVCDPADAKGRATIPGVKNPGGPSRR